MALVMQNAISAHMRRQIDIGIGFCAINGLSPPIITPLEIQMIRDVKSAAKLKYIIDAVEAGQIGLDFPGGPGEPMNLVGLPSINADQIQSYQLEGVLVIIGGVMIIAGLTLKVIELYERVATTENNAQIAQDYIDTQIAQSPGAAQNWERYKQDQGWYNEQTALDALKPSLSTLIKSLQKPLAVGVSWGIPIVIAVIGIAYLMRQK